MRIVFIGTVEFSLLALKRLIGLNANIVGVVTKENSSFNADFCDLVPVCEDNAIPYKFVNDINHPNNVAFIRNLNPDVIFCFGWSSLIKKEILSCCPLGVVGYHPAELPFNKGRHPLIWALVLGLPKTASTFFFMDEGADTGDIISQKELIITELDDARSLYNKVIDIGISQIEEFLPQLQLGTFPRLKQDPTAGNSWRKRGRADGKIDFRMSSKAIYNLVRALTKPYVGAHVEINGNDYKVWKTRVENFEESNLEPGRILKMQEGKILVKTYDSAIWLDEHELPVNFEVNSYL